MEIQKQILLFFSGIHNDFLDALMQFFTLFGEEFLLVAISVFIYWNISRKNGFLACMSLLNSLCIMGVAKAIVRFPRPWTVIDNLETVRQHTATGYSFPSGHTTSAASTYSAMAASFRRRSLAIVCAAIVLLVGFSRMYLCVHWPMDVMGGIVIGVGTSLVLGRTFANLYEDKERSIKVTRILGVATTSASLIIAIVLTLGKGDALALEDMGITLAIYGGLCFGYSIERRIFDFEIEENQWGKKILRFVIGIVIVGILMFGLKAMLKALGMYNIITRSLRYFLVGVWGCIYPMVGKKFHLFTATKEHLEIEPDEPGIMEGGTPNLT